MITSGTIIEYTRANGSTVETRTTSNAYQLYGVWVIDIIGERFPIPLSRVKESPRFIAAKRFYGQTR